MALAEELGRFLSMERPRVGSRERLSGFSHAIRLLGYVHHARDEQEEASAEFLINLELQKRLERRLVAAGRRPGRVAPTELEPEQRPLWEEGGSLSETVVRHGETFYVFARLLLDRLAQAIERYFGRVEEAPLRDHLDVERNLAAFAAAKGLPEAPDELIRLAGSLAGEFCSDRDVHTEIGNGSNRMVASIWSASGDVSTAPTAVIDVTPQNLAQLATRLEDYFERVVSFVAWNRR